MSEEMRGGLILPLLSVRHALAGKLKARCGRSGKGLVLICVTDGETWDWVTCKRCLRLR